MGPKSGRTLRIIDASLNRVGEGLRFLEDIARLLLNDASLSQQLKAMRHGLLAGAPLFNQGLLQSRDVTGDVGVDITTPDQAEARELPLAVVANARRAQEALRTLEELARTTGSNLDPERFKEARFNLYTLEQTLVSRLLRRDKAKGITGLYVIIDTQALAGRSHIEVASQAIRGGARVIQLRDKLGSKKELLPLAQGLKSLCAEHNVLFIMNDYLDLALASDADGLHLGQDDLPVGVARELLPIDKILGCSTTTAEQAVAAESEGADYIAAGSIYPTPSKAAAKVIGLAGLRQIKKAISRPLVAIGGITRDNVAEVLAAGADSVAVIGAVVGAESPEAAAREIAAGFKA